MNYRTALVSAGLALAGLVHQSGQICLAADANPPAQAAQPQPAVDAKPAPAAAQPAAPTPAAPTPVVPAVKDQVASLRIDSGRTVDSAFVLAGKDSRQQLTVTATLSSGE